MTQQTTLVLCFGAGFVLESLYLVRRNPRWPWLAGCAALGLLATFMAYLAARNAPAVAIGLGLGFFGFMFAGTYRDEILPVVGDKLLLAFTVIFWYGFATHYYQGTRAQQLLMLGGMLPSAASLYIACVRPRLGFWGKLLLYVWFLAIVLFLGLLQFPFRNLHIFTGRHPLGWLGPIDAFATGMVSLYLLANAVYLVALIPIPGRDQSFGDRMKQWHTLTDLMTQRCSDEDGPRQAQAFSVIAAIAAGLCLNYVFALLPSPLVISVAIILSTVMLERVSAAQALSVPAAPAEPSKGAGL